ncbi:Chitin synthesis regulation- Congo red resistance- RCR protein [Apiospora saccharicola]|uniref:Chitin synthesis regulation- Congo red resistance- RCR protein n=1 Tax=Apiospora saccharicola TaxID=335842 RepID=A0ABR1WHS6_9PEZI
MAPFIDQTSLLGKRSYCTSDGRCYGTIWGDYGRWIFAAIVVVFFVFVFFILACITSRRRRRRGAQPMYGTGWMAGNGAGNYQNNPQAYAQQPPPAYGAHNQSYPMNNYQHNGYYSGQNEGVQAPKNVYPHDTTANNATYAPPEGPPPTKSTVRDAMSRNG